MKKVLIPLLSLITPIVLSIIVSSCKKDDSVTKPVLSFSGTKKTVQEGAGTIDLEVDLDRAYSKDIIIEYSLDGTATDKDVATATNAADYEIDDNHGEILIKKGETKGTIEIKVISDTNFEPDETIDISLDNVNTNDVSISSTNNTFEVTIANDDAKVKPSFTLSTLAVKESDGVIQIEVKVDKAPGSDLIIGYDLSGTAIDSIKGKSTTPTIPSDYAVKGTSGQVKIAAGQTTGKIQLQLYSDFYFEDDETINIAFNATNPSLDISSSNAIAITLAQEDGTVLELDWDYTNVDMDMFLWIGNSPTSLAIIAGSANDAVTPAFEQIFIPAKVTNASFGASYIYYAGTQTPMDFKVLFVDFKNGEPEDQSLWTIFDGHYTTANIHAWTKPSDLTAVEQTFDMTGGVLENFSTVSTPASGSRAKTYQPSKLDFRKGSSPVVLRPLR